MKVLSAQLANFLSGLLTMTSMVALIPAISIYQQAGAIEGFFDIWFEHVLALAPLTIPLGVLLGFMFTMALRPFVKPPR